jgi:gliding motility-associated-like protein
MKQQLKIVTLIVGTLIMPFILRGQCMTLSEPLLLQAPDSLCMGQKDLVVKASSTNVAGAKYVWRTPVKDTVTTDSVLRITQPSGRYSGNYSVAIRVDTCQTVFFGPIVVRVLAALNGASDTVKTVVVCNNTANPVLISPYKTSQNVFGKWLGTEGVNFDSPSAPNSVVKGLKDGESLVIWTLSTTLCPNFVKDSFLIRREIAPKLLTTDITLRAGESNKIIHLGQIEGSNLNLIKDVRIAINKQPKNGILEILNDGKRIKYSRTASFQGQDAFELAVCNAQCPNLCSAAIPYTIDVQFDERYPNVRMPKVLAPKEAIDGRLFSIDKIENYLDNQLVILNRWGNVLLNFKNYSNTNAWNGMKDGSLLPSGAYYYLLETKDPKGTPLRPLSGIFYLVY